MFYIKFGHRNKLFWKKLGDLPNPNYTYWIFKYSPHESVKLSVLKLVFLAFCTDWLNNFWQRKVTKLWRQKALWPLKKSAKFGVRELTHIFLAVAMVRKMHLHRVACASRNHPCVYIQRPQQLGLLMSSGQAQVKQTYQVVRNFDNQCRKEKGAKRVSSVDRNSNY